MPADPADTGSVAVKTSRSGDPPRSFYAKDIQGVHEVLARLGGHIGPDQHLDQLSLARAHALAPELIHDVCQPLVEGSAGPDGNRDGRFLGHCLRSLLWGYWRRCLRARTG